MSKLIAHLHRLIPHLALTAALAILQALDPVIAQEREKVGLVLSGGGARGVAHIGVIRELERQRIPIDYITGTSMGAIVGALYASGKSVDEIESLLGEIDWDGVFIDESSRRDMNIRLKYDDQVFQFNRKAGIQDNKIKMPSGVIIGQKLQLLLNRLFIDVAHVEDFDNLTIPFRAVATDITTGDPVVLGSGDLATVVRASMSVPPVFATVLIDGKILVDGGISNNMPVDVARDMGADVVIAVDIGSTLNSKENLDTILDVSSQLSTLMVRNTTRRQLEKLGEKDILITPELNDFSSSNFKESASVVVKGEEATRLAANSLTHLSLGNESISATGQSSVDDRGLPVISYIRIINDSELDDEYIRSRLSQESGEVLDIGQLEKDISVIYGLGIFKSVSYDIEETEDGRSGLVVEAEEKSWGPRYLQLGLGYSTSFAESDRLSINLGWIVTPFNSWNAEWRSNLRLGDEPGLFTEFHQPLGLNSPWFVNGSLFVADDEFRTYEDGNLINQIAVFNYGTTLSLGRDFNRWGDTRLGLTWFSSDPDLEIGVTEEPLEEADGGEVAVGIRADTFDHAYFPKKGVHGHIRLNSSSSSLGSEYDYDQFSLELVGAFTPSKNTYLLGATYGSTYDGLAPLTRNFRLGGLFRLPGFVSDELYGQNIYLLRSAVQRRMTGWTTRPYTGFSLQYGDVYEDSDDLDLGEGILSGGIWLGWDTRAGPIFTGYGLTETGEQSVYLYIGSPF